MDNDTLLLLLYFLTGFFGDILLQFSIKNFGFDWGLKNYFIQHGSVESMCIAGGMLTLFFIIYRFLLRLPVKWYYIVIYAIILDLLFRILMIFPSLKGYYEYFTYFWSAVWAIIPMTIPLVLFYLFKSMI